MKITHVICQVLRVGKVAAKTASCQDAVLVRVRADDGTEGIGEADSSPGSRQGRRRCARSATTSPADCANS